MIFRVRFFLRFCECRLRGFFCGKQVNLLGRRNLVRTYEMLCGDAKAADEERGIYNLVVEGVETLRSMSALPCAGHGTRRP